ncbi:MAG: hypothetical protein HYZ53_21840 [Planctomycetes bacterium]|nr:hypothetical protein [Planctomycetota bacterium]
MPVDYEEAKKKLSALIKQCPVCAQNQWGLLPNSFSMPIVDLDSKKMHLGGEMVPVLVLACQKCGHLELFNPMHLGVYSKPSPSAEGTQAPGTSR